MSAPLLIPGTCRAVIVRTARAFGFTEADLTGKRRLASIVRARNAAAWVLRQQRDGHGGHFRRSYPVIARALGRTDHSSAIYWVAQCAATMAREADYAATVLELLEGGDASGPDPAAARAARAVKDLPAQVLRNAARDEMCPDDSDAVMRFNGSQRLLAALEQARVAA